MKAGNKFERYVETLTGKLKPITQSEQAEAFRRTFPNAIKIKNKTTHVCLECGHEFESTKDRGTEVCPHCGKRGEVLKGQPQKELRYYAILEKVEDLQVIRYFILNKWYYKGMAYTFTLGEVVQRWISPDGKEAIRALPKRPFINCYTVAWAFGQEMSFKRIRNVKYSYYATEEYDYPAKVKVRSLIPYFKRYGWKKTGHTPYTTLSLLLHSPHHGTLYETGQLAIFGHTSESSLNRPHYGAAHGKKVSLWQIAKVCTRNGCIIKDFVTWRDILDNQQERGRDMLSPKYVCVSQGELKKIHDRLLRQRQQRERMDRIARGENLMKNKKELSLVNREYKRMHKKYLDIFFESDGITFRPLQNVQEFYEEGKVMHHCVFTNRYYTKPESLILTATRGDKRLATIEVQKHPFRILQCYAEHDSIPKENKKLRTIIEKNEKLFHIKAS
ncbi:MAG: PcfJ domain-containing protein [Bacteroidales bacterium]|nr:PcfJ domain-containing protein [Candidatus Colicola faecequi]